MKRVAALAGFFVFIALAVDLCWPFHRDLGAFDPHEVARLETNMWRSYYEHRRLALFWQLSQTLRAQYGAPPVRSFVLAYHAANAAVIFQQGHGHSDYEKALPALERFYEGVRRLSATPFDPARAARFKLDWWIVHRERKQHPRSELELALSKLQAEIYGRPPEAYLEHARYRAEAMFLRDELAARGGVSDSDWRRIGALLDLSWSAVHSISGSCQYRALGARPFNFVR